MYEIALVTDILNFWRKTLSELEKKTNETDEYCGIKEFFPKLRNIDKTCFLGTELTNIGCSQNRRCVC